MIEEIASIIDAAKGQQGYFAGQLEASFAPMLQKLKDVQQDTTKISFADLFKMDAATETRYQKKYENAMKAFLNIFGKKIGQLNAMSPEDLISGMSNTKNSKYKPPAMPPEFPDWYKKKFPDKDKSEEFQDNRNALKVNITAIDDKILKKLGEVIPTGEEEKKKGGFFANFFGGKSKDGDKKGGLIGFILKGLGALLFGAVGALFLFQGFNTNSRLKGLFKVIGLSIIQPLFNVLETSAKNLGNILEVGVKKLVALGKGTGLFKRVGAALAKPFVGLMRLAGTGAKITSKSIPVLGSLISFAFAYSRFKAGDNLGAILEVAAGIASLVPVVGTAISAGINIILAARDLTVKAEDRKNTVGADLFKSIKKIFLNLNIVKSMTSLFGGLYKLFTAKSPAEMNMAIEQIKTTNVLAFLPFIGPMITIYELLSDKNVHKLANDMKIGAGKLLKPIWDKIWNFGAKIFKAIGEWFSNLSNTTLFRKIKIQGDLMAVKFSRSILTTSQTLFDIIAFLNKMVVGIVDNPAVKGVLGWLGMDGTKAAVEDLGKQADAFAQLDIKTIRSGLDSYESMLTEQLKEIDKQEKEDRKKYEEQRKKDAKELKDAIDRGTAAANGTTAAVLSTNTAPERASGNTTNIFNYDGENNIRRVKDRNFRESYAPL